MLSLWELVKVLRRVQQDKQVERGEDGKRSGSLMAAGGRLWQCGLMKNRFRWKLLCGDEEVDVLIGYRGAGAVAG